MSADVVANALQMPYVAYAILGKGGVVAVLLMLFQAITSALSSGETRRAFIDHALTMEQRPWL